MDGRLVGGRMVRIEGEMVALPMVGCGARVAVVGRATSLPKGLR